MQRDEIVKQIHPFTSRFVPMNIVEDVVLAIHHAGLRVIAQDAAVLPSSFIPADCTDAACQELSRRLPGDCNLCKDRKPKEIPNG
jgi:hypothetical protein